MLGNDLLGTGAGFTNHLAVKDAGIRKTRQSKDTQESQIPLLESESSVESAENASFG